MTKQLTTLVALIILVGVISLPVVGVEAKSENSNKGEKEKKEIEFKGFKSLFKWNDDSDDDRLPPGLRRAPGIEKRVESGKGLPFGWFKKLSGGGSYATSTRATSTRPFFLTHLNDSVGTSTAVISWSTTSASDSRVYYSTTSPATTASQTVSNSNLVTSHALALSGLTPNTTYYYFVASANATKSATSSHKSFTTKAIVEEDDETPKIIFNTLLNLTASGVRLIWVTDEASDSRVWVGTSTPLSLDLAPTVLNNSDVYYHDLTVSGLTASTTYHYVIGSRDDDGNLATSSAASFTTE